MIEDIVSGGSDFFDFSETLAPNIVTNPPYKYGKEWVEHSLKLIPEGGKLALLLPLRFLSSKKRRSIFEETPPKYIYVFSSKIECGKNGIFKYGGKGGSAEYAWFVWEKGVYNIPKIKWI